MTRVLTLGIVDLLHKSSEPMSSGLIARRLHVAASRVQSATPNLVKAGFIRKVAVKGKSFNHYAVDDDQWNLYLSKTGRYQYLSLSAQPHDALSRKIRFLDMLARGVHHDNPVLAEITADYQGLRRQQAEKELGE